jgi:5-carboxymethyl-2-hydroxymuconate isomerase
MPHFILEYSDNLKTEGRIPDLLKKVAGILMKQKSIKPGAIRVRAIELNDYCIADGAEDYAFVHAHLKIGSGRSEEEKQKMREDLFGAIREHFSDLYARRYLALSLEISEFSEGGTSKLNNIHARFDKWLKQPE